MTDDNSASDDDHHLPAVPRHKRRRKRKKSSSSAQRIASFDNNDANINDGEDFFGWRHHPTTATTSSSSSNNCNALDAELENQVNQLIIQSSNQKKTKKLGYTSCRDKNEVHTKSSSNNDMSTSLPTLLHIRELGLSSHLGRHNTRIPFVTNVDSLDGNGNNASWMTLLLHQPAYSPRKERGEKQQRHSDGADNAAAYNNDGNDDDHSNIPLPRRLRVPIILLHNHRHVRNDTDDDNYNKDSKSNAIYKRKAWRAYTQQTIQFSKLNTSHSVAILALDQWGGYSIGVANAAIPNHGGDLLRRRRPALSLKFFGVPSPARLLSSSGQQQQQQQRSSTSSLSLSSPLAHSIPLLLDNLYNSTDSEDTPIQIHDTPLLILLCSNGAFGVGYVFDPRVTAPALQVRQCVLSIQLRNRTTLLTTSSLLLQDDCTGTLVIFETPRDGMTIITKSLHCYNVRIGARKSFTVRNALWPTIYVPVKPNTNTNGGDDVLFDANVTSAYMLFNDEDDGFRITWINPFKEERGGECATTTSTTTTTTAKSISLPSHTIQAARNDIVMVSDEHETWEECLSDPRSGLIHQSESNNTTASSSPHTNYDSSSPGLDVTYEVYLHIDALLIDIITRRQQSSSMFKMSPYQSDTVRFIPNFYYNLVSVSGDGLNVTLVIVFSNKEKMMMQQSSQSSSTKKKVPAALGVVVNFGIFSQCYNELKWVQHPSCEDDSSMKQWCNSLALNWRMKECGVGVFCLEQSTMKNDTWVGTTHERNVNDDLEDDYNIDLWSKYYIEKEEAKVAKNRLTVAPPKDISMSSLYPHCDVITNRAVFDAIPVKRISSRKSSTDLIYG